MSRVLRCAATAAAFAATLAQADAPDGWSIRTVSVDLATATLQIEGEGLCANDLPPRVQLVGHEAPLYARPMSANMAAAALPEGLGWGAYVVRVSHAADPSRYRDLPVEIGVVGPAIVE